MLPCSSPQAWQFLQQLSLVQNHACSSELPSTAASGTTCIYTRARYHNTAGTRTKNTWHYAHNEHTQHTHELVGRAKEGILCFLTMDQHRLAVCLILEVGQRAADCRSIPTMAAPRLLNKTRTQAQVLAWRCHRRARGALQTSARSTCPRIALRESTAAVQHTA